MGPGWTLSMLFRNRVPWYIMTSPATHEETQAYFREQGYFGLQADQVVFFQQVLASLQHLQCLH